MYTDEFGLKYHLKEPSKPSDSSIINEFKLISYIAEKFGIYDVSLNAFILDGKMTLLPIAIRKIKGEHPTNSL